MHDFLFVTCQIGSEKAVKQEIAAGWPAFRFAYSQPGFLTFRLPTDHGLADDFEPGLVFGRSCGFSLGRVGEKTQEERIARVWEVCKGRVFQGIHVWERDRSKPGEHGFEPGLTPAATQAHEMLVRTCPHAQSLSRGADDPLRPAKPGKLILDCVILSADQWWIGYHRTKSIPSCYPGGLMSLALPAGTVSRAWLKMEEALRWSELPIPRGARVAEIGSAPGGASQALLARGCYVLGIDPAEMAPAVLEHPRFTHLRRRSTQVRRREFDKIRWLTADMNVAPGYTLDAVEAIVTHPRVSIRGLLLTLKLSAPDAAEHMRQYLGRVRSWGYNLVRARQLQYNRREVCVAALQRPFHRKPLIPPSR